MLGSRRRYAENSVESMRCHFTLSRMDAALLAVNLLGFGGCIVLIFAPRHQRAARADSDRHRRLERGKARARLSAEARVNAQQCGTVTAGGNLVLCR
jgi:hypothetical protein